MKHLSNYINIRKGKSTIKATDDNIKQIVKAELDHFGHDADLNFIDTSEVTSMYSLFITLGDIRDKYRDCNPDVSKWNVSNVVDMRYMFYKCCNFNCDISEWDAHNVKLSQFMLKGCKSFNQDLSAWTLMTRKPLKHTYDYILDLWFEDCPIPKDKKASLHIQVNSLMSRIR